MANKMKRVEKRRERNNQKRVIYCDQKKLLKALHAENDESEEVEGPTEPTDRW